MHFLGERGWGSLKDPIWGRSRWVKKDHIISLCSYNCRAASTSKEFIEKWNFTIWSTKIELVIARVESKNFIWNSFIHCMNQPFGVQYHNYLDCRPSSITRVTSDAAWMFTSWPSPLLHPSPSIESESLKRKF